MKKFFYNKYRKDFLYCCKSYYIIFLFCFIFIEYLLLGVIWVFFLIIFFNYFVLCVKRFMDWELENVLMLLLLLMYLLVWMLYSLFEK